MTAGERSEVDIPDFRGLNALVTGGTGGLGRAICQRLIEEGCAVVGTGGSAAEVAQARAEATASGIKWAVLDVTDGDGVRALLGQFQRLDVLVNLAGAGRGPSELEEDGFIHTVDVNLFGTMRACYAAHTLLAERGGTVVNAASMMSFFGSGTAPAYAASKGAVAQFTKSLAIAWASDRIRVNAVAPGWIETPMTVGISNDSLRSQEIVARTPLGRWGRPDDVAEAILFLASPRSAFVTGVILPVDGGYLIDGSPRPTASGAKAE
jgi:NAD(P)-dependent dehydrogenase (short-subunit alcohol dehydrogenase family)